MLREMHRVISTDRPFENRPHTDYSTNNHHSPLCSINFPDCCLMAFLSWGKPLGPRNMRRPWSNTRERMQSKEKEQAEDSSYPKGIEVMLRETARKNYPDPDNVDNSMIAPQDYDVHQSGRVLEHQNKDLWIRLTDLSIHFPILVATRKLPFKKLPWKITCEAENQWQSQEAKDSEKRKVRSNTQGYDVAVTFLLAMRSSTWTFKVIHGDENNVCLWLTTTFRHSCHLLFWCDMWDCFPCVVVS